MKTYVCLCSSNYKRAIRVNYKTQDVTFEMLGKAGNRNVIGVWCGRCGSIQIDPGPIKFPMARVLEDLKEVD